MWQVLVIVLLWLWSLLGGIGYYGDQIANNPTESLYVLDMQGNLVLAINGDSTGVLVTPEEHLMFKGMTIVHNHPNGIAFFSEDDKKSFSQSGALEMWVVTNRTICCYCQEWCKCKSEIQ